MSEAELQSAVESSESAYSLHPDLILFVKNALADGDNTRARDLIKDLHAGDLAELITYLEEDEREWLITSIRHDFDPEILVYLEPALKDSVIDLLGAEQSAEAISELETDDAVAVIEELDHHEQQEILEAIPDSEQRTALVEALASPEDTAVRLMNNNFVAVPDIWTVGITIDYLRQDERLPDNFYEIYAVDGAGKPVGGVLVSLVIRKNRKVAINSIMRTDLKLIDLSMDQEEVAYIFRKYGLASAPVVDKEGKLVGVISVDDVVDVIDEEVEEDILRLGGVTETDLHSNPMKTAAMRFPWLCMNLLLAFISTSVIANFADTISHMVMLAALLPLVASLAGNTGTQAVTVSVRALATKELGAPNAMRHIRKEAVAALINSVLLGAVAGLVSFGILQNLHLSLVFSVAIIVALTIGGLAGGMIPLILSRMKADPAIASTVFLTAVTDVSSFLVFLLLASHWLV